MTNLDTLSEKQQQAILEGVSFLCRIFWGPDPQLCQAILEGKYLRPCELLSSLLNYEPPDLLLQLTGSTAKYADSQALYQYLEMHYVRLFINSREGITAPLYQSCYDDNALSDNRPTLMGAAAVKMKQRLDAVGLSLAENLHDLPQAEHRGR